MDVKLREGTKGMKVIPSGERKCISGCRINMLKMMKTMNYHWTFYYTYRFPLSLKE